jgi:hypothetical protein
LTREHKATALTSAEIPTKPTAEFHRVAEETRHRIVGGRKSHRTAA